MKVFISHSADGAAVARRVAAGLREQGLQTWLSEEQILPGDNWAERVSEALKGCNAMVALLTRGTLRSGHVQWEMGFALGDRSYRHRLVPVLVGTENEVPSDVLPWILERFRVLRLEQPDRTDLIVCQITDVLMAAA